MSLIEMPEHKVAPCPECDEPLAHYHRPPGGGPWFCAACGHVG